MHIFSEHYTLNLNIAMVIQVQRPKISVIVPCFSELLLFSDRKTNSKTAIQHVVSISRDAWKGLFQISKQYLGPFQNYTQFCEFTQPPHQVTDHCYFGPLSYMCFRQGLCTYPKGHVPNRSPSSVSVLRACKLEQILDDFTICSPSSFLVTCKQNVWGHFI